MCAQFFCCLCPVDGEWIGEIPQTEHSAGTEHQRADSETESNRQGDALRKRKGKEILEKFWIQEIFSQKCLKGFINIFFSMLPGAWYQSQTKAVQNRSP